MNRFLHVGFMFSGVPKMKDLEAAFTVSGDWVRYSSHCWLIWTNRSATDVFSILKPYLDPQDQFLIVEVNLYERNGWLPEWVWKWMNDRLQQKPTGLAAAFQPPPSWSQNPWEPPKK